MDEKRRDAWDLQYAYVVMHRRIVEQVSIMESILFGRTGGNSLER
jgi:hypothetical protein